MLLLRSITLDNTPNVEDEVTGVWTRPLSGSRGGEALGLTMAVRRQPTLSRRYIRLQEHLANIDSLHRLIQQVDAGEVSRGHDLHDEGVSAQVNVAQVRSHCVRRRSAVHGIPVAELLTPGATGRYMGSQMANASGFVEIGEALTHHRCIAV